MTTAASSKLLRADGVATVPPKWLVLGINNTCNLHCRMCDVGLGDSGTVFWANLIGDHPQNMTLDLLREVLCQAAAFAPRPKIGLAFTEPLIHPHILAFCREIVTSGFYCEITTNGTQLPRLADALVEIGVDEIVISVDGPPEIHNQVRGGHETFQKLYRGVEMLNVAKTRAGCAKPMVRFSFTITDVNYRYVLDFVQAVEPLRPEDINITQLNFITQAMADAHNQHCDGELAVVRSNLGEMSPEQFDVSVIADQLQRVRNYGRDRGLAITLVPDSTDAPLLQTYYTQHDQFVGGRACTDPWKMMMVKTDGAVIPAHGRCYNYALGNICDAPLSELWNGPRMISFRKTLYAAGGTLPACARCCGIIGKTA